MADEKPPATPEPGITPELHADDDRPVLLIVAGPNGSGKSTLHTKQSFEAGGRSTWVINPDELTRRILKNEKLPLHDCNLAAVKRMMTLLEAAVEAHQSVGFETVLSTDKYRNLVLAAKARGYEVVFMYVVLDSAERCVERVQIRVAKGLHHVPDDKIRSRYQKSLKQMSWFLYHADAAQIWDNSGATPVQVGEKVTEGRVQFYSFSQDLPKHIQNALEQAYKFEGSEPGENGG